MIGSEVYNRTSVKFAFAVACKNVFYKTLNQICGISVVYLSKPLRQFSSDFIHILGLKNKLLLNLIKCNNCKMTICPFFTLFWLVHSCLPIEINFVKFVCFISMASVQMYIQVVPLCDCNNNIRKQVYVAFEQVLFNSTSK